MSEELKPHQIAQLVNKLRDIATKYHAHGCLRELISREVNAALTQRPAAQTEPDHAAEIARLKAVIDQLERREILAVAQQATPEPVGDVRCEGCGYMTHHREHMGCVRAAKQHTHPAPGVPEGFALVPVEPTAAMLHCIVYDQYPQDADEGRKLQRKQLGEPKSEDHVPFKTEFELAVGQYKRLLAAAQAKGGQ